MPVKSWSVGDVLTASDMNLWTIPIVVIKPADTARNNTTLANDPDLILPVAASSTYDVGMVVFYDGAGAHAADLKYTFTIPAGASGQYWQTRENVSASFVGAFGANWTDSASNQTADTNGVGSIMVMNFKGILAVAGTAGNLTFQWAQNTLDAGVNTHVKAQSYMVAQRIA